MRFIVFRISLVIAAAAAATTSSAIAACAPLTAPCSNDDECAHSVCVEGRCVDPSIGQTPDLRRRFIRDESDDEDGTIAHRLAATHRALSARPVFRTPDGDEVPPEVPPEEPSPFPPPINDDDEDLFASCDEILQSNPDAPSGFYVVRSRDAEDDGEAVIETIVECEMRSDGGWTIIANLLRDGCPAGWSSSIYGCERPNFNTTQIASAFFAIPVPYRDVRGGARAWSMGNNRAFDVGFTPREAEGDNIYVDGLALSVNTGAERAHLWTFAAGDGDPYSQSACPSAPWAALPPDGVLDAYSCDARVGYAYALWDGDQGDEDFGDFVRFDAPSGDVIEARLMSPLFGFQSPVWIMQLFVAVK